MSDDLVGSQINASIEKPAQNESGLSIVVPVYNEEGIVTETALSLTKLARDLGSECEVIFVNDGSSDGTAEALSKVSGIRVICHPNNRGYGAALKTGIRAARHQWIAITDADGTYPNQRIPELFGLAQTQDCDMVVGSRTSTEVHIPLIRRPAKWVLGKLASYLAGYKIKDLNSGLRVMKKDIIMRFSKILPDGFSFTTTITLAMLTNGHLVEYIPINYHKRKGDSKIRPIRDTLNFVQLIIRTVLYFNPLKIFIPLSLLLVLSAFLLLFTGWFLTGTIMDTGTGLLLMSALLVMAIGMLADLIDKRMP
jgi:glycosyltransferase involved in cell wall biosynthesis